MTETEYRQLVMDDFDRKLAECQLPLELVSPTRKSLKDHCVHVCTQRFEARDELLLSSVFNKKENRAAYVKAIQNTKADHFRTLHLFLHDRSIHTSFTNICLLAWMIGFEPRPYHQELQTPLLPETGKETTILGTGAAIIKDHPIRKNSKKITLAWVAGGIILLGICLISIYRMNRPTGTERCMIWQEDHYEPVDCIKKHPGLTVFEIDHHLIDNFKRITQPDTLTLHSVRKVWYIKTKGRVLFFTAPGPYPLDSTRRLLPMTDHILKKYVYHLED